MHLLSHCAARRTTTARLVTAWCRPAEARFASTASSASTSGIGRILSVTSGAVVLRPVFKVSTRVLHGACTATGAVTLGGLAFVGLPYVWARAPMHPDQKAA